MEDFNLDWDSEIAATSEREFKMIDEGEYDFTVTNFEKTRSQKGAPMAKLSLGIEGLNEKDFPTGFVVFDYLVLTKSAEWKLSSFFECIGLKKKGEPIVMRWDKVDGATGRVKIKHDLYQGKKSAKVDRYLPAIDKKPKSKAKKEPDFSEGDLPFEL